MKLPLSRSHRGKSLQPNENRRHLLSVSPHTLVLRECLSWILFETCIYKITRRSPTGEMSLPLEMETKAPESAPGQLSDPFGNAWPLELGSKF